MFIRGFSGNKGKTAFRKWYACLQELRSLLTEKLPVMALTATASKKTKVYIHQVLSLSNPFNVNDKLLQDNITYSVQPIEKGKDLLNYFEWLINDVKEKGLNAERVLVYCQTIKQCSYLYQSFIVRLGTAVFGDESQNPRYRIVEMMHSKTPESVKETILDSFAKTNSHIRVLFSTIAFGMGINAKGVRTVIHVGPSKNIEAYVQESGRGGRDGMPSKAMLLYNNLMCLHCEKDIKDYIADSRCRRVALQEPFELCTESQILSGTESVLHMCCDNCAKRCNCNDRKCKSYALLPNSTCTTSIEPISKRVVSPTQRSILFQKLQSLRKSIALKSVQGDQKGRKATVISCPSFFLEFTDIQIKQVMDNCGVITSIADIFSHVEIWQKEHAESIYKLFYEIFHDVPPPSSMEGDSSDDSDSDDLTTCNSDIKDVDESFQDMQIFDILSDSFEMSTIAPNDEENAAEATYPDSLNSLLQNIDIDKE